jgi:hypothetical protein
MAPQFKAHPAHPAVDYLVRLHADIGGRIKVQLQAVDQLKADMVAVETVIHMFDPNYDTSAIVQRRRISGNPFFKRGTMYRDALDVLRKADKPMSPREMVLALLAAKGITTATDEQLRGLAGGLNNSLRNNEGKTVETVGQGHPMRWRLRA